MRRKGLQIKSINNSINQNPFIMKKILTLFTALILFGSMGLVQAVTYTPAGTPASVFTAEWAPNTPANDMTLSNGLYVFAQKSDFAQTSISFKVCQDHAWTTAYPGSDYNYTIPAGAKYLIITFNPSGNAVNAFAISSMTVAGDNGALFGSTWDPSITANDMTLQGDGTYKFEKEHVALAAGTINFKACANHSWDKAWPGSNYSLSIPESGEYTITITFDPKTLVVSATADLEVPVVVIPTIQIHSNITNPSWESSANFTLAGNEETASLTLSGVTKGNYEFGVKIDGTWTSNGSAFTRANNSYAVTAGSGNCTFNADRNGDYTFTWTFESNTLEITYPAIPAQSVIIDGLAAQILKGTTVNFADYVTSSGIDEPGYRFYVKPQGGDYSAVASPYTFAAAGEYVVKVEALEYNTGDPVASDESEVVVYDTHTFTSGTILYVDFSAMIDGGKGVNYPYGDNKTSLDYDAAGAGKLKTIVFTADVEWTTSDVFIKTEKAGWDPGMKFTVPGDGQNCAVVAADGASYTWGTYVAPVTPPTVEIKGGWDGWTDPTEFFPAVDNQSTKATVHLTPGNYDFKLILEGDDWRSNNQKYHRFYNSASGITDNLDNMEIQADAEGDYIFVWTYATNTLSISFPETPATGTNEVKFFAPRNEEHPWNEVYVYAWRRTSDGDVRLSENEWPGDPATKDGEWYKETVDKGACVIFHDNAGMQSFDIENVQKDVCYVANEIVDGSPIKAKFTESCTVNYFLTGDEGIMGAGNAWKADLAERQLDGSHQITLSALPAGMYEFKLTNGSWAWSLGGKEHLNNSCSTGAATTGSGNVKFKIESAQDVTISYDPATQKICLNAETMLPLEDIRTGLTPNHYYTICYPKSMTDVQGATLWSFVGKDTEFAYIEQETATTIEAGKPYLMYATASTVQAVLTGDEASAPVENGAIHGTFSPLVQEVLDGLAATAGHDLYLVIGDELRRATGAGTGSNTLPAQRAYVIVDEITGGKPAGAPGKKVRSMPMQKDQTQGFENLETSDKPMKVMIEGTLYILRGEKVYDATGRLVK